MCAIGITPAWASGIFPSRVLRCGDVEVWRGLLQVNNKCFSMLSSAEKSHADGISDLQTRERFVAARAALRRVLAAYSREAPSHLSFSFSEHGKPSLAGPHSWLHFNIAHTDRFAIVAVARDIEVGVDVELADRNVQSVKQVAKRRFTSAEYEAMLRESNDDEQRFRRLFLETWTRKEAFVKCTGEGISRSLRSFEVSVGDAEKPQLLSVDGSSAEAKNWSLRSLRACIDKTNLFSSVVVASPRISHLNIIEW